MEVYKGFYKPGISISEKIKQTISKFSNLQSKLKNKKELPDLYSVNISLLSPNILQQEKYPEGIFTYYCTKYRKQMLSDVKNIIEKTNKIILTGIQDSGKSYFLSDFVLRHRLSGKDSEYRFIYVNNSEELTKDYETYIFSELIYAFCFDSMEDCELKDFPPPPVIYGESKNQIFQWIQYLYKKFNQHSLKDFLKKIKVYFNGKGIKVILVWDQINVLHRKETDIKKSLKIFEVFEKKKLFDLIFLSASNMNDRIYKIRSEDEKIEVNPFLVFSESELQELIRLDCEKNHPKDIHDLTKYAKEVFVLTQGSLSEYHHYKTAWNWNLFNCKINEMTFRQIKDNYLKKRNKFIYAKEAKFQVEKIKNFDDLMDYVECLRKSILYKNYQTIKDPEEKALYFFPLKFILIFRDFFNFWKIHHEFSTNNF